jgi:hypothetical protein
MESMMKRTAMAFAFVLVASGAAVAQQTLPAGCDSVLAQGGKAPARETQYTVRGTATRWCEGVFTQKVGNVELILEAFTSRSTPFSAAAMASLDTIIVEWAAPAGAVVHLRARQAIDPSAQYYQMDVEIPTGADGRGVWKWPVRVLRAVEMWPVAVSTQRGGRRDAQISVQAFTKLPGRPASDQLFIPVRIRSASNPAPSARVLELAMLARERIAVSRIQLDRIDSAGTASRVEMDAACPAPRGGALGNDLTTITICMPDGAVAGTYQLSIAATSGRAQARARGIRFYYRPDEGR